LVEVVKNTPPNGVQVGTLFGTTGLDSPTAKSGPVPVPSISAQKRNGNIVGYSVYLGTEGNERRVRKFFPKLDDAEKFVSQKTTSPVPVGELWEKRMETGTHQ
jgi:hypothetical protein